MKKYIILKLQSSEIGSQLFLYAFGRHLSEVSDKAIYLDYSSYIIEESDLDKSNCLCLTKFNLNYNGGGVLSPKDKTGKTLRCKYKLLISLANLLSNKNNKQAFLQNCSRGWKGKLLRRMGIILNYEVFAQEDYYKRIRKRNLLIRGIFETPYYANKIKSILLEEITLKKKSNQLIIAEEMITQPKSVAVHISKSALEEIHREECNSNYYIKSIMKMTELLGNDAAFFVFSDDFEYAKKLLASVECKITYIEWNLEDYEELILMSECRNFIISGSPMSWWGQFLCQYKSKKVISTARWHCDIQGENNSQECDWITMEE